MIFIVERLPLLHIDSEPVIPSKAKTGFQVQPGMTIKEKGLLTRSEEDGPHHIVDEQNNPSDDHREGIVLNQARLNSSHHA
jgi:hypothetical protein